MAKRQTAKKPQARPRKAADTDTVADSIAVYIGRTVGELLKRKDDLQSQLTSVEAQIATARRRVGSRIKDYLPTSIPALTSKATATATAVKPRRAPRRPAKPQPAHGMDHASEEAAVVARGPAAIDRTRRAVPPRSAPRTTRRG